MYYTGLDPRDLKPVYVTINPHEKAMQRALIQFRNPENYDLVKEALLKAGRQDLIGFDKHCLIPPRKLSQGFSHRKKDGVKTENKREDNFKKNRNTVKTSGNSGKMGKSNKKSISRSKTDRKN